MSVLDCLRRALSSRRPESDAPLAPGDAYAILSNERRRRVLARVVESDEEVIAVSDIADYLRDEWDESRQTAYVSMIQQHLPKMAEAGLLDYDDRAKTVAANSTAAELLAAHREFSESLA